MALLNNLWLPSIFIIPFFGTLFLLLIPSYESLLRKRVSLFVVLISIIIHIRNSVLFFQGRFPALELSLYRPHGIGVPFDFRLDILSCISLSYLFIIVFLLFYCEISRVTQAHFRLNSEVLFVLTLTAISILSNNFGFALLVQYAVIMTIFAINLREGGSFRSSSTMTAAIFFTAIDLAAFFSWTYKDSILEYLSPDLVTLLILLPAATRLTVPFLSPWARLFFANCTVEITILYLATTFLLGPIALARMEFDSPFLASFALVAAGFGALLSFGDRTLKGFLTRLPSIAGCFALAVLVQPHDKVTAFNTVIYVGNLSLVIALGLFLQRAIADEDVEKLRYKYFRQWVIVVLMILSVPFFGAGIVIWKILPAYSSAWLLVIILVSVSLAFRTREALLPNPSFGLRGDISFSKNTGFNTWSCILLVLSSSILFQLFLVLTAVTP